MLFTRDRVPFATGRAEYLDAPPKSPWRGPGIVIQIQFQALDFPVSAVIDTAAPWCILQPNVADRIIDDLEMVEDAVVLSTRLGLVKGRLYRGWITLPAEAGEDLDIQATIFLSPEWRGENFIGYKGMLNRMRFAVDPATNLFYFGEVGR